MNKAQYDIPRPGIYRHYKGSEYEVLDIVRHSETEQQLVLYRALYGDFGLWVRPLEMFVESVDTDEGPQARFTLIEARPAGKVSI